MLRNPAQALSITLAPPFREVTGQRVYELRPATLAIFEALSAEPCPLQGKWAGVFERYYAMTHEPKECARLLCQGRKDYAISALEWGSSLSSAQLEELTSAVNQALNRLSASAPRQDRCDGATAQEVAPFSDANPTGSTRTGG